MGFYYLFDYQLIMEMSMSKNVRICPGVDMKYGRGEAAKTCRLLPLLCSFLPLSRLV